MKKLTLPVLVFVVFLIPAFGQKSNFVEADGIKFHYLDYGKGTETILLVHGLTDTAEIWRGFAPILADKYKVIAIDRRGVGKSQKTETGYNINTFAEDIRKIIDKLELEKIHIVGHSFGGNIVMTFGAKYPNRLKTLTLIEGGFWEKREKTPEIAKCPEPIEQDCLISNEILEESYIYNPQSLFGKITVPTLFVMGIPNFKSLPMNKLERTKLRNEYQTISLEIAETARTKLKKGKFVAIKNAEHWVFRDQPQKTGTELLNFIKAEK